MKTLENGCPQFDLSGGHKSKTMCEDFANSSLQSWHDNVRCVNCKNFLSSQMLKGCYQLGQIFEKDLKPETFSCAAFEVKK